MRVFPAILALALSGCVTALPGPAPAPLPEVPLVGPDGRQTPRGAALTFLQVIADVEPVAEALCRERRTVRNCDIRIVVDDRPGQPPNAFQTLDRQGRPIVGFTLALIADARNADELAFVLGHEAAHHIAGHIPKRQDQALSGALLAGVLAQASGLTPEEVRAAQNAGAELAARSFSKEFELEADALGTEIALRAGYDPLRGTAFFDRLPDPGDKFLGSHPPNGQRKALVRDTVRRLTGR
jgi:Zn-dependent protease with chaperone function